MRGARLAGGSGRGRPRPARPVPIGSDPHPGGPDGRRRAVALAAGRDRLRHPGREDARRHLRRHRRLRTRPDARTRRRRRPPRGAGPRPARRPATPVHRRAGSADPRPARRREPVGQIAATFGVSRSTVYRALQAPPARTPPPAENAGTGVRIRHALTGHFTGPGKRASPAAQPISRPAVRGLYGGGSARGTVTSCVRSTCLRCVRAPQSSRKVRTRPR